MGVVVFCVPLAMLLARCHMYRLGWFVTAGMVLLLATMLVVEVSSGPELSNGVTRLRGQVLPLLASCLPALIAFAVGARLPMKSD